MKMNEHATCEVCGKPFSEAEWEDRHSTADGEDCHAKCCPDPGCNPDLMRKQYIAFSHADALLEKGDQFVYFFIQWEPDDDVLVIRNYPGSEVVATYTEAGAATLYRELIAIDGLSRLQGDWPLEDNDFKEENLD